MAARFVVSILFALLVWSASSSAGPQVLRGNLGSLGHLHSMDTRAIGEAASQSVVGIVATHFEATGAEQLVPQRVRTSSSGRIHIRFTQTLNGLPVAGVGLTMHASPDGTILGINGQFISGKGLPDTPKLDADAALGIALAKRTFRTRQPSLPVLTYVLGRDQRPYLAWQMMIEYRDDQGPQRDLIFADSETGRLVARHPQHHYLSIQTKDCFNKTRRCGVVSETEGTINTGDLAIDSAHNYAIATYDYFLDNHGRDSIDDNGMRLVSRVHYGRNYNNAFWDGSQMTYGDGDGVIFSPLSQDADVVAHELTHGITERTSGLIYSGESGALNEAMSDIFGALVDRQEGAVGEDIWLLGEDIYTPDTPGDGLRNMADPAAVGDYDWWPTRYTGSSDNGGVHWNSGIANLAFVLLVEGGSHPRSKSTVVVPRIGFEEAAAIFYEANVNCLTPGANFAEARYCTADIHGGVHKNAVHLAWDAVGVPTEQPPAPNPLIELSDGVPLGGQDAETGNLQQYVIDGLLIDSGDTVNCTTTGNNGDADLYLRFNADAEPIPDSTNNECGSYSSNSNESCTSGPAQAGDTLFAGVHAYAGYTDLSITCNIIGGGICLARGAPCSTGTECCSGSCGGKRGSRTCK